MITPLEAILTCSQLTGLGVFYTYYFVLDWAFHLPTPYSLYAASIGTVLVYLTAVCPFNNFRFEPRSLIVYGLSSMSLCSATLATCLFAENDEKKDKKSMILHYLPKISILAFFISFYATRIACTFYVRAIALYRKEKETASLVSWIVTFIVLIFKVIEYDDYVRSLGACMIAFGFLFLSISFFITDRLPVARGLFEHEIAQSFGLANSRNVIKHEEHRSFTSDGANTYFVRNLTNCKVLVKISFSNPECHLIQYETNDLTFYIRARGHLRIHVAQPSVSGTNDRFFIFFSKNLDLPDTEDVGSFEGFVTVVM